MVKHLDKDLNPSSPRENKCITPGKYIVLFKILSWYQIHLAKAHKEIGYTVRESSTAQPCRKVKYFC